MAPLINTSRCFPVASRFSASYSLRNVARACSKARISIFFTQSSVLMPHVIMLYPQRYVIKQKNTYEEFVLLMFPVNFRGRHSPYEYNFFRIGIGKMQSSFQWGDNKVEATLRFTVRQVLCMHLLNILSHARNKPLHILQVAR